MHLPATVNSFCVKKSPTLVYQLEAKAPVDLGGIAFPICDKRGRCRYPVLSARIRFFVMLLLSFSCILQKFFKC